MGYKHVLFATDLMSGFEEAADKAKKLAGFFGAKLSLVHVVEPIPTYAYSLYSNVDLEHKLLEEAKAEVAKLGKALSIAEADQHVVLGAPKFEVLAMRDELKADLIIVSTHSKHGLSKFLGSTANGIVQGAHCDVLTLHLDEKAE